MKYSIEDGVMLNNWEEYIFSYKDGALLNLVSDELSFPSYTNLVPGVSSYCKWSYQGGLTQCFVSM